jgi:membrane-associated phospholipid phosphatase
MPAMTRPATARPKEDALLRSPRQTALLTAGVAALTTVVFALAAGHPALAQIQRPDDAWLRLMISGRAPPLTAIAKIFNVLGLAYITLPVRIALAGFLAARRRWWHLAAFTAAIMLSEILIGPLKDIYDRPRPPGSLVATSGASFPSGHATATAASVTVLAAVIALTPPGRRRAWWAAAAVTFSLLMGLSRAYLAAHWLSDGTQNLADVPRPTAPSTDDDRHLSGQHRGVPSRYSRTCPPGAWQLLAEFDDCHRKGHCNGNGLA